MANSRSPTNVLLAVDGSEHSLDAARRVVELFGHAAEPIEVLVLNVQEPIQFVELAVGPTGRAIEEARQQAGHAALAPACEVLEAAGLRHRAEVRFGHVAPTIDACARETGCRLIVIGPRGLGPIRDLVLGSVAAKLIHLSRLPLLLGR